MQQSKYLQSLRSYCTRMHGTPCIGLGFGLVALALIVTAMVARSFLKSIPGAAFVVNAAINLLPFFAAVVGAYAAPQRKMKSGIISGLLSLLPTLTVALLALGIFAPLVLLPLLLGLVVACIYVGIGAALGSLLCRLMMTWRSRTG